MTTQQIRKLIPADYQPSFDEDIETAESKEEEIQIIETWKNWI